MIHVAHVATKFKILLLLDFSVRGSAVDSDFSEFTATVLDLIR